MVIVIVNFDDFPFFGPDIQVINTVKKYLADQYKMKDLRSFGQFTEIKLDRNTDKKTISLSPKLFCKAFDLVAMSDCKTALSSIVANTYFTKNPTNASDEELIQNYQSHLGTYIWEYVYSWPDLGYAMSTLSRFFSNWTRKQMIAMRCVYRYLQATKDLKIIHPGGLTEKLHLKTSKWDLSNVEKDEIAFDLA